MSYTLNKTDGSILITLPDQTTDTSACALTLIGRGTLNYGEFVSENFIRLMENFNNDTAPAAPLRGQVWSDSSTGKLKMWNGTSWVRIMTGVDDGNTIPGLTFGTGLTMASGTLSANVRTVAGRTGDVVLGISDVAGGAPLDSPLFINSPRVPTAAVNDSSTLAASTAFVRNQIAAQVYNYGAGLGLNVNSSNALDIVGTASRISVSSAGVNIAADYRGQGSIDTLGTVTSGNWNAGLVPVAFGGTGASNADQARTNILALKYNSLANSLGGVGNGILTSNNGAATARKVVSGSPEISVVNGDGVGGDISIALINTGNTGPLAITSGGTGAGDKTNAFNNLSPATTTGDLILYGTGGHERLASFGTGTSVGYLISGAGNARPRWSASVDSTTLAGHDGTWYTNRANHTGTNNADQLNGQAGSYYLDMNNMGGLIKASTYITASSYNVNGGYVCFANGIQMVWGSTTAYRNAGRVVPYPLAFPSMCFFATVNGGSADATAQDNNPFVVSQTKTGFYIFNSRDGDNLVSYFAIGI